MSAVPQRRRLYGSWLLRKHDIHVLRNRRQGPRLPKDLALSSLRLIDFLEPGESKVDGYVMRDRAMRKLNAPWGRRLLWWLLNHQDEIPKEWRRVPYIVFVGDDDLWLGSSGQIVLCLLYNKKKKRWSWWWSTLDCNWRHSGRVLSLVTS